MAKQSFSPVSAELRRSPVPATKTRKKGARSKMASRGPKRAPVSAAQRRFLVATWLGIAFMLLYALTIGQALSQPGYSRVDRIASVGLLFGLGFIMLHGLGYANSMLKANWGYRATKPPVFASSQAPRVACLISSFNEPPEVLEETVAAVLAMDYAAKDVFILDDSTKPQSRDAAREIAARFGIRCVQRTNRHGFKAGAINAWLPQITADYIALFDADALPTAAFLSECVPQIEANPKLAFLQTPQFYANAQVSYTALASSRQQNVFYEYICEGKSVSRAAFCCGTNVIFRRAALEDVGGFNERSVTEDFATSFTMHARGWDSLYLNRVYVYSLAPENLAAYFTQQGRWSFGTLSTARQFLKQFVTRPRSLSAGQWWEYFLSATYYLVGWVNFLFILLPIGFLFFDVKPLRQDIVTYLLVFVPYLLFTLNMFYSGMETRGYRLGESVLGQQIGFLSFPIHMKSALSALLGQKRPFGVTPKGVGGRISWFALWPQLGLLILSLAAFVYGTYRAFAGLESDVTALGLNSLWAFYHVWMLGSVFRLNRPVREGAQRSFFDDAPEGSASRAEPLPDLEGIKNPITVGRVGVVVGALVLGILGLGASYLAKWSAAPATRVNVYVVDRTLGPNARAHRDLVWTLNYLKIQKAPTFAAAAGSAARLNYDIGADYFGTVPDPKAVAKREVGETGAPIIYGLDRQLPPRLSLPGAIYLADTYGEYQASDPKTGQKVRFRGARRGLSAPEIDAVEVFARRGGLVMGEWNTLGYPTKPGNFVPPARWEQAIDAQRRRLERLNRVTVPRARETLRRLQSGGGTFKQIRDARGFLADARGQVVDATFKLSGLQSSTISNTVQARQGAAAERLGGLLHVQSLGWYGRFIENFAREKAGDPALWKLAQAELTQRNRGRQIQPSGAGFVFYPDAPRRVFDPERGAFLPAAFSHPIVLQGADLGPLSEEIALIKRNRAAKVAADPLIQGLATQVPDRGWFEVVAPARGALVLANHHLKISAQGAARLQKAGFPARYIVKGGLMFPAAIAARDGDSPRGELRSLYIAGEVAGAPNSPLLQKMPGLGGIDAALTPRFGDLPSRTYWGFFEPLLRGALETPRIRSGR